MKKNVFISYASDDTQWATWIAEVLERNGFSVFIGTLDLQPGDDFVTKTNEVIRSADVFMPILSDAYNKSVYCTAEFGMTFRENAANKLKLIPIRVSDTPITGLLASIIYVDLSTSFDREEAEYLLILALDKRDIVRTSLDYPVKTRFGNVEYPNKQLPANNLPMRNRDFLSRAEQLANIDTLFKKKENNAINICQTVSGLGGIDKTQLAIEYAYRYCSNFKNCIWFINAETTTTMHNDFVSLATHFDIKLPAEFEPEELQWAIKIWLSENKEWLLIFDNLETADTIKPYLPDKINGRMIITTRNTRIDFGSKILIGVFGMDEALEFLKKRLSNDYELNLELYNDNDFDTEAQNLITRLGFLPLALEQAAAYIREVKCTLTKYLTLLSESGLLALEEKYSAPKHYKKSNDYEKIVTATWNISFKSITCEGSRQLLNLCAYMAPDRIPVSFLAEMRDKLPSPIKEDMANEITRNRIITELRIYSLTSGDADYINIHRLVQETILLAHKAFSSSVWLNICLEIFLSGIPRDYDNWEAKEKFSNIAKHAYSVANYTYSYFENQKSEETSISELYFLLGYGFNEILEYNKALECYHKAIKIREKILGKKHPDTVMTYNYIADVYTSQGYFQKALEWYHKVLEFNINTLGEEHLSISKTYNNIALVYFSQGNDDMALMWYQKALAINEKILGTKHPVTATIYNNIAEVYTNIGDYTKALECYQKTLAINEKILGQKHPTTAMTYNNIALVYFSQGNYDMALMWSQKALEVYEIILGKEHPDTTISYDNIASIFANQKNYSKALEYYQKALAINIKALGNEHPNTVKIHNSILAVMNLQNANDRELVIDNASILPQCFYLPVDHSENIPDSEILAFCEWYTSLNGGNVIGTVTEFRMFLTNLRMSIKRIKESSAFVIDKENALKLCQYTKLDTLKSLVKAANENDSIITPKLRLSNVAYMNDPSEGQFFINLLNGYAQEQIFDCLFGISYDKSCQFQSRSEVLLNDVYISCFSKAKDNLPMWTQYGDNSNGCCMIFDDSSFISPKNKINLCIPSKEFEQVKLYKVHYYNKEGLFQLETCTRTIITMQNMFTYHCYNTCTHTTVVIGSMYT